MTSTPATRLGRDRLDDVQRDVLPLADAESLDPLLERIGAARYVAIGEASHGTAEFYAWRAALTWRLITEKGFSFVAVEGDWPDCQALHCSITGAPGAPEDPRQVLDGFARWPRWMWANTEVLRFARRLREHNLRLPAEERIGFFGLDVYSLWDSLHAVLAYLREHRPDQVEPALAAYRCFEPYADDPESYALASRLVPEDCEAEVVSLLTGLRRRAEESATGDGRLTDFAAWQNAEVLAGAERYYRAILHGGAQSWNIRDHHMADTLDRLTAHHGPHAKAVIWEHNTHVGDARATDMAGAGLVNVGQLLRERHQDEGVVLIGFGSYDGTVIAAEDWSGTPTAMTVPPARQSSVEAVLHDALTGDAGLFVFGPGTSADDAWHHRNLDHRAIGVVYRPERERWGNYVPTVLDERYDAFLYLDHTRALEPLHPYERGAGEEETYPSGE